MMKPNSYPDRPVYLVDDEEAWTNAFGLLLKKHLGLSNLMTFNDSRKVMDAVKNNPPSLVLLDLTMPYLSGDTLLEQLTIAMPEVPVIMITGRSELELAIRCMKFGAYDYFIKTEEEERILAGVRRAQEHYKLHEQNRQLKNRVLSEKLEHPEAFADQVTGSRKMHSIFNYVEAVAKSSEPVLIVGESGVGKELLARAVHLTSCPERPWVAVNIAGLDDNTFSDTLFGHVRGAFTGADQLRKGLVEEASGGVVFLDEIGDLPPESQIKLLRFIQEGEYYPLGSDKPKKADVRLVFATNHDLQVLQNDGRFRNDLYYRLKTHQIMVPALRDRPEDIPLLIEHYLEEVAKILNKKAPRLPAQVVEALKGYRFPGNIRELRGLLFDAVGINKSGVLSLNDFNLDLNHFPGTDNDKSDTGLMNEGVSEFPSNFPTIKESTKMLVVEALKRSGGNRAVASKMLGISQAALSKRLKNMREESD